MCPMTPSYKKSVYYFASLQCFDKKKTKQTENTFITCRNSRTAVGGKRSIVCL